MPLTEATHNQPLSTSDFTDTHTHHSSPLCITTITRPVCVSSEIFTPSHELPQNHLPNRAHFVSSSDSFCSPAPSARAFAAVVPTLNLLRLLALGMGWAKDEAAVRAISRGGQRRYLFPIRLVGARSCLYLSLPTTSHHPLG